MADLQPIEEASEINRPTAYISERHRNPGEAEARPTDGGNYVVAGICAILATLAYAVVVAMLWVDWQALQTA